MTTTATAPTAQTAKKNVPLRYPASKEAIKLGRRQQNMHTAMIMPMVKLLIPIMNHLMRNSTMDSSRAAPLRSAKKPSQRLWRVANTLPL